MQIVKKAAFSLHSEFKGVRIFKRDAGTGTCGGNWLIPVFASQFSSLKKAQDYLESNPQYVTDALRYQAQQDEGRARRAAKLAAQG